MVINYKWVPTFKAESKFNSQHYKTRLKSLRYSSDSFIKKVRVSLISKQPFCSTCYSKDNLQIDHIVSVHHFARHRIKHIGLNAMENLQVLCRSCNSRKAP